MDTNTDYFLPCNVLASAKHASRYLAYTELLILFMLYSWFMNFALISGTSGITRGVSNFGRNSCSKCWRRNTLALSSICAISPLCISKCFSAWSMSCSVVWNTKRIKFKLIRITVHNTVEVPPTISFTNNNDGVLWNKTKWGCFPYYELCTYFSKTQQHWGT